MTGLNPFAQEFYPASYTSSFEWPQYAEDDEGELSPEELEELEVGFW
jgi:hypothetical protein